MADDEQKPEVGLTDEEKREQQDALDQLEKLGMDVQTDLYSNQVIAYTGIYMIGDDIVSQEEAEAAQEEDEQC